MLDLVEFCELNTVLDCLIESRKNAIKELKRLQCSVPLVLESLHKGTFEIRIDSFESVDCKSMK